MPSNRQQIILSFLKLWRIVPTRGHIIIEYLRNIENILISACDGLDVSVESVEFPFVKSTALARELRELPRIISLYNATTDVKLRMTTKITTLADVFKAIPVAKVGSPEIHSLLMLYYTMPL